MPDSSNTAKTPDVTQAARPAKATPRQVPSTAERQGADAVDLDGTDAAGPLDPARDTAERNAGSHAGHPSGAVEDAGTYGFAVPPAARRDPSRGRELERDDLPADADFGKRIEGVDDTAAGTKQP